jgi:hypothetical protein
VRNQPPQSRSPASGIGGAAGPKSTRESVFCSADLRIGSASVEALAHRDARGVGDPAVGSVSDRTKSNGVVDPRRERSLRRRGHASGAVVVALGSRASSKSQVRKARRRARSRVPTRQHSPSAGPAQPMSRKDPSVSIGATTTRRKRSQLRASRPKPNCCRGLVPARYAASCRACSSVKNCSSAADGVKRRSRGGVW